MFLVLAQLITVFSAKQLAAYLAVIIKWLVNTIELVLIPAHNKKVVICFFFAELINFCFLDTFLNEVDGIKHCKLCSKSMPFCTRCSSDSYCTECA